MIDFHTHILPGIDDGSKNVGESLEMIRKEMAQGVEEIIFTPHFYADKDNFSSFLECRNKSWQALKKEMNEQDIDIAVRKGAEVCYFEGIGDAKQITVLSIEGTDLILLEMPFTQWTEENYRDVRKLIEKRKLTVILAHVERFYKFQKDKTVWNDIFELPLYAQINTGNINKFRKKHFIRKFLKKNVPIILGSDCHNMNTRTPNMKDGRDMIRDIFGDSFLENVDAIEERLLKKYG